MEGDLISVILPIYRVENYLMQSIESLIKQSYKNIEIILVDDGSPDNCPDICDQYALADSRIKVLHKKNGGVSSARNAGLKASSGTFIYFMDPDDLLTPRFLEYMYQTMITEDCDMVVCAFTSDEQQFQRACSRNVLCEKTTIGKKELLKKIAFSTDIAGYTWNKLFKRSLIGELSFDESVHMNEDQLFTLQYASRVKKATLIQDSLYYYRVLDTSAMNQKWNDRKASAFITYLKITKLLKECDFPNEEIQSYAGEHAVYLAINYFAIIHEVSDKLYWNKELTELYAQLTAYGKPKYASYKKRIKAFPYVLWFGILHKWKTGRTTKDTI